MRFQRQAGRAPRRAVGAGIGLAAVLVVNGCEPCALTFACRQSPVAAITGQLVNKETGVPVANALVQARYDRGVSVSADAVETRTSSDGYFELDTQAVTAGTTWFELRIVSPGERPYVVRDVQVQASLTAGGATVLAPWVSSRPEIPYALFVAQQESGEAVAGATVTFERLAGPGLVVSDTLAQSVQSETGEGGVLFLFSAASADTAGDIIGRVIVGRVGLPQDTITGVVVRAVPQFRTPHKLIQIPVP